MRAKGEAGVRWDIWMLNEKIVNPPILIGMWILVILGAPCLGWSAEWAVEPRFSLKGEFNDNILLTSFPHESVYGIWASPDLRMRMTTERTELAGDVHLDFVEYVDNADLDMTQQFYTATLRHRRELMEFGLSGNYTRDSILLGELVQTGVLGPVNLVERRRFRTRQNVEPTWTYHMTERWSSLVSYNFSNVDFDVPPQSGFIDFYNHVGTGTLTHQLSQTGTVYGTTQVIFFDGKDVKNTSFSVGGELGGTYQWTERFKASLYGGGRFVKTEVARTGGSEKSDQFVGVFGGTVEYQWERFRSRALVSRNVSPTGLGALAQTDRVSLTFSGNVTEKISASLTGEMIFTEVLGNNDVVVPESEFLTLRPSLQWRWNEDVLLAAAYHYRHLEQKGQDPTVKAESHAFTLSLTYAFPSWTNSE